MRLAREIFGTIRTGLGRKLTVPVILVVVLLLVPFAFALRSERVNDKTNAEIASNDESVNHISAMEAAFQREEIAVNEILYGNRLVGIDDFQRASEEAEFAHQETMSHVDMPAEAQAMDECLALHQQIHNEVTSQLIPAARATPSGTELPGQPAIKSELKAQFDRLAELKSETQTLFEADRSAAVLRQVEAREFSSETLWASMIVATTMGLLVALFSANRIVRSLRRTSQAALEMARGDLTQRVDVKGNDELAAMGRSFNDMADSLARHTQQLEHEKTRIRAIHQSIGDAIIVVDRGGVIISVNPAAERALGKAAMQLERTTNTGIPELQKAMTDRISVPEMVKCWEAKDCHKTDCPSHDSPDRRCWLQCGTFCYNQIQGTFRQKRDACERCDVFMRNAVKQFEIEVRQRHYSAQIVPILDDEGQEEGKTIVLHDITDLQHAKEEIERSAGQLAVLNRVNKAAASSLELDTILSMSISSILGGTVADAAFVHTMEPGAQEMELVASLGIDDEYRDLLTRIPLDTGSPGRVLAAGKALIENDLTMLGGAAEAALGAGFLSYVGAPLEVKKGSIGVLSLVSVQKDSFTEEDARLLDLIGNQVGMAVENSKLFNSSVEHARKELAHSRIAAALTTSLELDKVYDDFTKETSKLVEFTRMDVVQIVNGEEFEVAITSAGASPIVGDGVRFPLKGSVIEWMQKHQLPYVSGDLAKTIDFSDQEPLTRKGLRSQLCMPLNAHGKMLGSLNLANAAADMYGRDDIETLGPIADQVALTLANQKLFQDVAKAKTEWETTFDSVSEGIAIVGNDHTILRLNQAAADMVGGNIEELVGRRCYEVIHGLCKEPLKCPMSADTPDEEAAKTEQTTPDGRTLELVVDTMVDARGKKIGAVHFLRDITESKRLRQQLLQSEKMVAVGQLVSGVAHEINNPLTGVVGYAQLLLAGDIDEKTRKDAEAIYGEAERATRIVRQLLSFARKHRPERTAVAVNQVLEESLALKAYDLRVNDVKAETCLDPSVPLTTADPHQLQQVFLNLITNAEQAMLDFKGAGRLMVESRSIDGQIRIAITDNGPGIPEDVRDRIFDPFFTTKEVGKGTGLGLSVCYGVVQDHGGRIWTEEPPEGGTRMIVELPVVLSDAGNVGGEIAQTTLPSRLGRILLVDDEASIRQIVTETLKRVGHTVDTASNGEVALGMLRQAHYDCVVSDLKMPVMDGKTLHQAVLDMDPALAGSFIFISGDTVNPETRTYLRGLENPCLSKPFQLNELEQVLQKVLASEQKKHG